MLALTDVEELFSLLKFPNILKYDFDALVSSCPREQVRFQPQVNLLKKEHLVHFMCWC